MYFSIVFRVILKLASITVFVPFAGAQSGGNLVCENNWTGRRPVKFTFFLQKFDFGTTCPGFTDGMPVFQHSTLGPPNAFFANCTAPDIRSSACNYQSGTEGCGCVGENSTSYIIEYNFSPDPSLRGYWGASVPCFDNIGGSPLTFTQPTCNNIPHEWNCEPLDMDKTVKCTNGFKTGSVCTRKCKSGLEALTPSSITCQEFGVWSGTLGSCKIDPGPVGGITSAVVIILGLIIGVPICCCCCVGLRKKCFCGCCYCKHDLVLPVDPKEKHKDNPSGFEAIKTSLQEADGTHRDTKLQKIEKEARVFPCCRVKVGFVDRLTAHEMRVIRNSTPNSTSTETSALMEVHVSSSNIPNVKKAAKEVKKLINKLNPGSYDIV